MIKANLILYRYKVWYRVIKYQILYLKYIPKGSSLCVIEIREAIYYLITTFITTLNRIKKKSSRKTAKVMIFIINLQNIEKTLKPKINSINGKLKAKIPFNIYNLLGIWKQSKADKVNPYYPSINYKVEVKRNKYNQELLLPYKLLHNILKNEFLIFKKTFKDLYNKGFIYTNNSLAIAPILFIRKPRREL